MYRPHMIDRNQMLVAGFHRQAPRNQIAIAGYRPIRAGTVLMCMIPPIWLKLSRHKLSQNVVPVNHLCRELSQTRMPAKT